MQNRSQLWDDYYNSVSKTIEYKAVIGTDEYFNENLYSVFVTGGLCSEDTFSLGNVICRKLELSIIPKATPIPKMANVDLYMRYNGTNGPTEWLPKGKYFIDTRQKANNRLNLECYDRVLMMEKPFIQTEEIPDFPMLMTDALDVICARLDLVMDNPTAINSNLSIEYPNELTMREVVGYIASANGGNFTITDDGKLRLVVPAAGTPIETIAHKVFDEVNDIWTVSRVTIYYDDENYFTAGDDTANEMVIQNIWATQAMVDHVLGLLGGYIHRPFTCTGAYINPAAELGDTVTTGTFTGIICTANVRFGAGVIWDIGSPGESALEHEYPYEGSYARAIKQKVSQNTPYYGVTISRANGLKIDKTDGSGGFIANADMIQLNGLEGETSTPVLYVDSQGKLRIKAIVEMLENSIITWGNLPTDVASQEYVLEHGGGISPEDFTVLANTWISTRKVMLKELTSIGSDPIITLFDDDLHGAAIDATLNNFQGKGTAIRFKWNDENYLLLETNMAAFYFSDGTPETRPNIRSSGYYLGSNLMAGILAGTGTNSVVQSSGSTASGNYSHAEGYNTTASEYGSHAEGTETTASEYASHAEGDSTIASGYTSHAEGSSTKASGGMSHAEGNDTLSSGECSHAEGGSTVASEYYAHAEGSLTIASAYNAHAEGSLTIASDYYAHAEGTNSLAYAYSTHAEGCNTCAISQGSHSEGLFTIAADGEKQVISSFNTTNRTVTLENVSNLSIGDLVFIFFGYDSNSNSPVNDSYFHCVASITQINDNTLNLENYSIVGDTSQYGFSISNWLDIVTLTDLLDKLLATPLYLIKLPSWGGSDFPSHAEGFKTLANGSISHAEGKETIASGVASHAQNKETKSLGDNSHSGGEGTIAQGKNQLATGKFNIAQGTKDSSVDIDHAFIIGNGTANNARSNALSVTWEGNVTAKNYITSSGNFNTLLDNFNSHVNKNLNNNRVLSMGGMI